MSARTALQTIKKNQSDVKKTGKPINITSDLKTAVETYLLAVAYRDTIKPIVDSYRQEIIDQNRFRVSDEWIEKTKDTRRERDSEIIMREFDTYLMSDDDSKIYFQLLHEQHLAHGFNVKKNYCPLLIANSNIVSARKLIVDESKYISGFDYGDISGNLDNLYKYTDLTVSLVVQLEDIKTSEILDRL